MHHALPMHLTLTMLLLSDTCHSTYLPTYLPTYSSPEWMVDEVPKMDSVLDVGRWYHEQLTLMIEQEIEAKLKKLNLIQSAPSTASSDLSDIPTVRVKCLKKFSSSAPSYTSTCSVTVESGKQKDCCH